LFHREERNEARRESRALEGPRHAEDDQGVIDYCAPGAAAQPPSFSGTPEKSRVTVAADGVVDYTKGGHDRPGQAQLDLSRVPGDVRRDRVRAAMMARDIAEAERLQQDGGMVMSWESNLQDIEQAMQNNSRAVDFSNSAMDGSALRERTQHAITNPAAAGLLYGPPPDYMAAARGQSVRRTQPPRQSGPQRAPHIII
jgi:hypothetical protein